MSQSQRPIAMLVGSQLWWQAQLPNPVQKFKPEIPPWTIQTFPTAFGSSHVHDVGDPASRGVLGGDRYSQNREIIGRVGAPYRGRNSFCICEDHMPPQIAMIQMAMPPHIAIFQMAMPPQITIFPNLALSSQVRSAGVKALGMEIL